MTQSTLDDYQDSGSIDHTDPETLRRLYWEEGLTMQEIADRAETTPGSVAYYMRKHDIERREKWCNNRVERVPMRTRKDGYEQWDGAVQFLVHRLLAISEYGIEAMKNAEVHHRNGIRWDNRPENLELLTSKEHIREHSQFTPEDIQTMREMKEKGALDREIADEFDTKRSTVNSIVNRHVWTDI